MNKLSKLFKDISHETWDRLEFVEKMNSSLSEPTITENLLYEIQKYNEKYPNNSIRIYEAKEEKTNGNDLEVYFKIEKDKYLFLAIQAKKLHVKTQKYRYISHKVSTDLQIDLLMNYAKRKNGIPLYLLYNHSPGYIKSNEKEYGCSLACASHIKKQYAPGKIKKSWSIPTFKNLHTDNAIPLFYLGLKKIFLNFLSTQSCFDSAILYKESELVSDDWVAVEDLILEINCSDSDYKKIIEIDKPEPNQSKNIEEKSEGALEELKMQKIIFNPKYKLIIDSNE